MRTRPSDDRIIGRYHLPLDPAMPPGATPLQIGLYNLGTPRYPRAPLLTPGGQTNAPRDTITIAQPDDRAIAEVGETYCQ